MGVLAIEDFNDKLSISPVFINFTPLHLAAMT